jgi:AraC-like DNA-binding protein
MDALTDVLEMCRLEGTVFSRAWLDGPWAVRASQLPHGIFHGVVRGSCWVVPEGHDPRRLEQGDVVFLPHGTPHVMCDLPGRPARPIFELSEPGVDGGPGRLVIEGEGAHTELICGSVAFDAGATHPLLSALPAALVAPPRRGREAARARVLDMITDELAHRDVGSEVAVARLTEVLLVRALRAWIEQAEGVEGWLGGLTDDRIARAMAYIHRRPDERWTVDGLARLAGMSRSSFSATFHRLVGDSPRRYLIRWRMHLASRALRQTSDSLAQIASRVGYASEFSFSKAFKDELGVAPSRYRAGLVADPS